MSYINHLTTNQESPNKLKSGVVVSRMRMKISDKVHRILENKSQNMITRDGELSKNFNQIYEQEFGAALDTILKLKFKDTIFKDLQDNTILSLQELLDSYEKDGNTEAIIKNLIWNMQKIPAQQAMSIKDIERAGGMYCSISAAVFQLIIERRFIGKVHSFIVSPYGHAAQVIQINNRYYYADARNGIFTDITEKSKIEKMGRFIIFRSLVPSSDISPEVPFGILPATTDSKRTMLSQYFGNIAEALDTAIGDNSELKRQVNPETFSKIQSGMRTYLKGINIDPVGVTDGYREEFRKTRNKNARLTFPELYDFQQGEEFQKEKDRCLEKRKILESLKQLNPEFLATIIENAEIIKRLLVHHNIPKDDLYEIFPQETLIQGKGQYLIDIVIESLKNLFVVSGITTQIKQEEEFERLIHRKPEAQS